MANKKILLLLSGIIFFSSLFSIFGQENEEDQEIIELTETQSENAEANVIKQPFAWTNAGDVLKYEISIEKLNESTGKYSSVYFHETNEEETKNCIIYFEPPLPPGRYRSTTKVYNILGHLEEDLTAIDDFIVYEAFMPEVKSVSYPLYMRSTIYLDDLDNDGIIEVEGKNLFITDKSRRELSSTDYILKSEKRSIKPLEIISHDTKNKKITFKFDMKRLDVGNYHLIAQDASGLHSEENSDSEFTVKFKKWMDLDIEAGYNCPVILSDDTLPTYLFSQAYPLSVQGKICFMPFKHSWGYLGIGLRASATRLSTEQTGYSIDGNLGTAHALFVYQLPIFRRRVITELHGGFGIVYFNNIIYHFPHGIDSEALNTICLSADAGLSAQIYINKRCFTEVAVDYVFAMGKDIMLNSVMPSVGVGWQF